MLLLLFQFLCFTVHVFFLELDVILVCAFWKAVGLGKTVLFCGRVFIFMLLLSLLFCGGFGRGVVLFRICS